MIGIVRFDEAFAASRSLVFAFSEYVSTRSVPKKTPGSVSGYRDESGFGLAALESALG